jgi:hypothetical protein
MRRMSMMVVGFMVGCGAQPAPPTVHVPPAAAGTGEASAAAAAIRPPRVAPCPPVRRHRLSCDLDPSCRGFQGTTPLERECSQVQQIDFDMRGYVDKPCSLLKMAALMDDLIEANDAAKLTTPAVVAAAVEYRASLVESRDAARALAEALQRDPASVESARRRYMAAAEREGRARPGFGLACGY